MLVTHFTGQTAMSNLQIEKPIGKIIVTSNANLGFDDERITVSLSKKSGGTEVLISDQKIVDIMEMSTFQEGAAVAPGTTSDRSIYPLEITHGGSIELENDETIIVELKNLTEAVTYEVFGYEHPKKVKNYLKYSRQDQPIGKQQKDINVSKFKLIAIEAKTSMSKLQVSYSNGYVQEFTYTELIAQSFMLNDMVKTPKTIGDGIGGVQYLGYENLFILPGFLLHQDGLINAVNMSIYSDGSESIGIFLVEEVSK